MKRIKYLFYKYIVILAKKIFNNRASLPHVLAFVTCNSPKKVINYMRVYYEIKRGITTVKSKPFVIFLEVNNICNLSCPFCLTGKNEKTERTKRNMTYADMKKSIDGVKDTAYMVQFYNWGEPLLNKDLLSFVEYVDECGLYTMISSNMNFVRPGIAEQIVNSKLDYLVVAIDGFCEETYQKYRIGGSFNSAIENLKEILRIKEERKTQKPFIEWQYVVFKHNQDEIELARSFAEEIGVDYFNPIPGYIEDPEWLPTLPEYEVDLGKTETVLNCTRPWTHMSIRADGGMGACCYEYHKKDDYGDIFEKDFDENWNNKKYTTARKILSMGLENAPKDPDTICHHCVKAGARPDFKIENLSQKKPVDNKQNVLEVE